MFPARIRKKSACVDPSGEELIDGDGTRLIVFDQHRETCNTTSDAPPLWRRDIGKLRVEGHNRNDRRYRTFRCDLLRTNGAKALFLNYARCKGFGGRRGWRRSEPERKRKHEEHPSRRMSKRQGGRDTVEIFLMCAQRRRCPSLPKNRVLLPFQGEDSHTHETIFSQICHANTHHG